MKPSRFLIAALLTIMVTSVVYAQDTTFTVTDNGNVGIGTTSPLSRLHVEAPNQTFGNFQNLFIRSSSTSAVNSGGGIGFGGRFSVAGGTTGFAAIAGRKENATDEDASGYLGFATNDGQGAIVEKVRITGAGNVGIGTTSPDERLTISYNQYMGWEYSALNSAVLHKIGKSSDGAGPLEFVTQHNPGPAGRIFSFMSGAAEYLSILYSGNVGIGTTTPNNPLEMASGAHVTTGGVWTDASSRHYKENISNLTPEEATAALEELNPVKFNYKAEKDEEYVGFIAEDVPALVASKSRQGLSPMDVVAVLTKVVQQQQKRIAELEARVDAGR